METYLIYALIFYQKSNSFQTICQQFFEFVIDISRHKICHFFLTFRKIFVKIMSRFLTYGDKK